MTAAAPEQQQEEQQPQGPPVGERMGSRWLYHHPSEEQVRDWFGQQTLHGGMEHAPYVGGIVVIGATEKLKTTMRKRDGGTYIREDERGVYTPYVKVDTRIAYFWDYVRTLNEKANDEKYVGVIEPVPLNVIEDPNSAYYNAHLPEGFFIMPIRNGDKDSVNRYLGARWSVAIYERESYLRKLDGSKKELAVLKGIGTKQSALSKNYADDNVVMKAETGAIGRALGVAGILVVGTGVATAEDMQEALAANTQPSAEVAPTLPQTVNREGQPVEAGQVRPPQAEAPPEQTPQDADEEGRAKVRKLASELSTEFPDAFAEYRRWYTDERKFGAVDQLGGAALQGAIVKLERTLDEQRKARGEEPQVAPDAEAPQ
jgi:hypothetical protein